MKERVAIIGAGIAGLTLALALQRDGIPFTVYELRGEAAAFSQGGAFTLFSNSLRFLDALGLYQYIRPLGCEFDDVRILNNQLELQEAIPTGNESIHGYKGFRILRSAMVKAMKDLLKQRGATNCSQYGTKFRRIVKDDAERVTFEMEDGSQEHASLLVGCDGVHSAVRKHISDHDAVYTGRLLILSSVRTASLRLPERINDFRIPCYIQDGPGSLLLVHDTPNRDHVFCMREIPFPQQTRHGWAELERNKPQLRDIFCQDKDGFVDIIQSVMEATSHDDGITIWPNMEIPELPGWSSPSGRVVLLGDSAHATPPASMQGANQAMEDAYSLSLLLRYSESALTPSVLQGWHANRWLRIEKIRLIGQLNTIRRMPSKNRGESEARLIQEHPDLIDSEMRWLLLPDLEGDMRRIINS